MTTRRAVLGAGVAALAATAFPTAAGARRAALVPRLRQGDTVAVVGPASIASQRQIDNADFTLRGMGLIPKFGEHVAGKYLYLAGTDDQRASDLNAAFADPQVRAIFALRGGWGGARILPLLDWKLIRRNPKLLIGYSDITALHLAFARDAGFPTIHAPNAAGRWDKTSWDSLWRLAFTGERPELPLASAKVLVPGSATGRLLGGNLTILSTLMGTGRLPVFDGAILFLEDIGEDPYRVDRMLQQLKLSGILAGVSGVIFGHCTRCNSGDEGDDDRSDQVTIDQVLADHFGALGCPVVTGANIGHIRNQLSLPHGAKVRFDTASDSLQPLEPVVS